MMADLLACASRKGFGVVSCEFIFRFGIRPAEYGVRKEDYRLIGDQEICITQLRMGG